MSVGKERVVHDTINVIKEIHDTVTNVVTDTIWVLNTKEESGAFECEVTVGDILTIVGFIITVLLFIRQIKEARKDYRTSQRDSWMLNVVIQPYIEHINGLYDKLADLLDKEIAQLKNRGNKGDKSKRNNEIAKLKKKTKGIVNDFFVHFITLLGATDKVTASRVDKLSSDLIDICTSLIDGYADYVDKKTVTEPILDNKQKVVATLYASMKSDNEFKEQKTN